MLPVRGVRVDEVGWRGSSRSSRLAENLACYTSRLAIMDRILAT